MERRRGHSLSGLFALLFLLLLATPALAAWDEAYCSSQNTGKTDVYTQKFMSNGNCTDHCRDVGAYAFAVIQYQDCYCSDLIPRSQTDISKCRKSCPGYGAENCGSIDDGLFIYIQNGSPAGTAPGPSSAAPTPQPVSSSVPPPPPPPRVSTPGSSSSSTSSTAVTTTSKAPAQPTQQTSQAPVPVPAPTPDLTTSWQVVTVSGGVITRTIVQTPSLAPSSSSAPARTDTDNDGPNVGAIAGGVAGGVIGLLAIIGGLMFVLWRRRKQREAQDGDGSHSGGITRNTSTMSKAGLLGGTCEVDQYPSRIATNLSTFNSRYGTDHESISPSSNRRNSQPLVIDSRLNPNAVMTFAGSNLSRESVASLDDSRDYGRQLNVRNPDP